MSSYTPEKIKGMETLLMEAQLMDPEDGIEEVTGGDYYPIFFDQVRGNYYFTHERVAFVSGWGTNSFSIKYSAIKGIKKSFIGPFLPFGVTVTAETEDGKTKKYKFSLLGRAKWIDFLSNKSGVSVH